MNPSQPFSKFCYRIGNRLIRLSGCLPPPNRFLAFAPPGHFYSPIPDSEFVTKNANALFSNGNGGLPGININASGQRELVEALLNYRNDFKPPADEESAKRTGTRFYTSNPFYKELDAFIYYAMLRRQQPQKIMEVGSGFSSALALDVCDQFLNPKPRFIFLDPYPDRLRGLLKQEDLARVEVLEQSVQQANKEIFLQLEPRDILFIDSSHVSKIGSDVNFLFFEILPRLKTGVIIHVHDIFWPFEYPRFWLEEGRCWNEAYLLRALLSNSNRYRILCSSSYLALHHADLLNRFPAWVVPDQSSSIWLEVMS